MRPRANSDQDRHRSRVGLDILLIWKASACLSKFTFQFIFDRALGNPRKLGFGADQSQDASDMWMRPCDDFFRAQERFSNIMKRKMQKRKASCKKDDDALEHATSGIVLVSVTERFSILSGELSDLRGGL